MILSFADEDAVADLFAGQRVDALGQALKATGKGLAKRMRQGRSRRPPDEAAGLVQERGQSPLRDRIYA